MQEPNTTYETATGKIEYTLKSDLMFHYVMQKSKAALTHLVCALKGIAPKDVKEIIVQNPIDLNNDSKETIMDLKLTLNNNEIINIELQLYFDKFWNPRSILYLCRAYDSISEGEDYSQLKPTTHICITNIDLIEGNEEFYSHYLLLNVKNHEPYSTDFGINVLQLNHIDNATDDDINSNLVYWARLFMATTWEEFKSLADNNVIIEEVGQLIFELNTDNQAKELMEGRRRYREQLATSYASGKLDAAKEYEAALADKDATIADKDATIADKDATIAELLAKIKELENNK